MMFSFKRRLLLTQSNVLLMRYPLCLQLNFQLLLRWKLTTSGNYNAAAILFSKSCVLDPLPSSIVKQCIDLLLPNINNIVNLSLRDGCMPTCLKSAVLSPLLKKPNADFLQFKNFRPISNLKALSKIIEKRVALQLNSYLMNNNLHENFQSAYKVRHSTETVMVKVQDNILHAIEGNEAVVLLC